jgi:DNA-binding MarR family transcriptional regulator
MADFSHPIEPRTTSLDDVTTARFSEHYLFSDADFLLARARAVNAARALPYLDDFRLNTGTYFVLSLACSDASPSVAELSQILLVSEPEAELLVDDLERLFLVARRPDPHSKNGVVIKATPQGEELFATSREALLNMDNDPMSALSLAERKQLVELLAKIAF